jgi:hypothetical protein
MNKITLSDENTHRRDGSVIEVTVQTKDNYILVEDIFENLILKALQTAGFDEGDVNDYFRQRIEKLDE